MGAQAGAAALPLGLPSLGPFLRGEFDLSLAAMGALLAAPTAGLVLMAYAWGWLSDLYGERRMIVCGMSAAAVLLLAAGQWGDTAPRFGALIVAASAMGAVAPAASGRAVASWFPPQERGMALSLRHTAPMMGGAAAAAALPWAASAGGLSGACLLLAGAELVGAACALTLLPASSDEGTTTVAAGGRHPRRDPLIWTMAGAGATVIVAQGVLSRFLPEYLHGERGWSQNAAGTTLSLTLLCAAVMRVGAGIASDRHGRRLRTLRTQAIAASVMLIVAGGLASAPAGVSATLLVLATGLTMAGNGVAFAAIAEIAPDNAGAALGLYSTMLVLSITVSPPLFGAAARGDLGHAFAALGLFPLAGAVILTAAERMRRRRMTHA